MRKLLSIFFMVVVLSGSTEFGEVLRIPILLLHFQDHQELDNDMSFVDFLKLHYEVSDDQKEFDPKDSSLPFKSCQWVLAFQFIALPPSFVGVPQKPILSFSTDTPLKDDMQFCSSYLSNVWQPPKSC